MMMAREHPRTDQPEHWRTEAACHGTDPTVFFDERHGTRALAICADCPVRSDCLQDALTLPRNEDQGIRGVLTPTATPTAPHPAEPAPASRVRHRIGLRPAPPQPHRRLRRVQRSPLRVRPQAPAAPVMSAGNVNKRARCPECGTVTGTFWHNGRRIFQGHGGSMTGDYCPGTGWLVEDDELLTRPRKQRSDAGIARPSRRPA